IMVDRITGRPSLVEGGVPWIPGSGWHNTIQASDFGVTEAMAANNQVPVDVVAGKAIQFIRTYPNLFGVDPADLTLMEGASGPVLDYLYSINLQWNYHAIPVEHAYVGFCLNNGNLVMFGSTYISDTINRLDPTPTISAETAWQILWGFAGKSEPGDEIVEPGRLLIEPVSTAEALSGAQLAPGTGMSYRLAFVLAFRRPGVMGTWEARVDAHTGEILSFTDENKYGHIQGGVYKTDKNPTQTEVSMPFPYADYGSTSFADQGGNFTGSTGTCTMTGRTGSAGNVGGVDIVDTCGAASLAANGSGLIDFSGGTGTDCTTPGVGGAGNTHAARTQYWNVSQIKIKAYTYLPTNAWLQGRVTDNVNLNQTCNAYWNGSTLNFFHKGAGSCANTGELPGVSLHEWGHGMDSNDGNGSSPDNGSGENYGDTTAFLQTHESCLGGGFLASNCGGYGNACTACTGVRDVDYAKHSSGAPATLTFANACPASATYKGPCGREGHCESYVPSEANWDLAARDLITWGLDATTAWQLLDKFWYASAANRAGAFICTSNSSNAVGNLFNQYRVVDDCDGNLANGTPHASAIWAAFSRHQIGDSGAVNTDNACGCASLAVPALTGTAGNNSNSLSWATVASASSYDVYSNMTGCTAGFTKIGNTASLAFTDNTAVNGVTYYYRIQALGATGCPSSSMSNCVTLTPVPCTTPGVPAIGTVTVPGLNQLQVSWTAGAPAGATYKIYRAILADGTVACTTGTYALLASGVAASPYTDSTVSGTVTYGYKVSAVDSTGGCESVQSGCAKNTATGTCNAAPNFAGTTGVTNPAAATCTLNVSWAPGTSNCAGTVSYNIYRSTTSPFTPAAGNRIASGVSGTS
ncbi:MAG: hypothetical protein PHR35_23330, partial [Kiritimatiellae bacterium]|nr:hypothetical protein [Kiritimatiellia bacterium]